MAYEKQNLKNGQVLKAEHLEKMEQELARVKTWGDIGEKEMYYIPETTCETADMGGIYGAVLPVPAYEFVTGDYTVNYNGVSYNLSFDSTTGAMGNLSILGAGDDTGEPFAIVVESAGCMLVTSAACNATVSILGIAIVPLELKYTPDAPILDLVSLGLGAVNYDNFVEIDANAEALEIVKHAFAKGVLKLKILATMSYKSTESDNNSSCTNSEVVTNANIATKTELNGYIITAVFYDNIITVDIDDIGITARVRKINTTTE